MKSIPDPRERPLISIPEAGAIAGMTRDPSYEAADLGTMPTIETSAHRRMVPTALWLAKLGLSESKQPGSQIDVDLLAKAIAKELAQSARQLVAAVISQGVGPADETGPDAAEHERGADPRRERPYPRPVA